MALPAAFAQPYRPPPSYVADGKPAFDQRLAGLGYRFVFSNDKIQRLGR